MSEVRPGYYWFTNGDRSTLFLVDLTVYQPCDEGFKVAELYGEIVSLHERRGPLGIKNPGCIAYYSNDTPLCPITKEQFDMLVTLYTYEI